MCARLCTSMPCYVPSKVMMCLPCRYALANTKRSIESCGILAGSLDSKRGLFTINTLIVPKQEGSSDMVSALNEEEIFEAQDKRSLYPLGWIHTHPSQTCFLSSIDIHTQCGYQVLTLPLCCCHIASSDALCSSLPHLVFCMKCAHATGSQDAQQKPCT